MVAIIGRKFHGIVHMFWVKKNTKNKNLFLNRQRNARIIPSCVPSRIWKSSFELVYLLSALTQCCRLTHMHTLQSGLQFLSLEFLTSRYQTLHVPTPTPSLVQGSCSPSVGHGTKAQTYQNAPG